MATAVRALQDRQVSRLILTRPAVEAGERLGYLPGTLYEKIDPYMRPLYDALFEMTGAETLPRLMERGTVEVAPLAYMRGRTLNDAFIILDEAQNTTPEQMKMFLTRIGFGSKAVINGDATQVDLEQGRKSGLAVVEEILGDIDGIAFCHLGGRDVVRHKIVQDIVEAYDVFGQQRSAGGPVSAGAMTDDDGGGHPRVLVSDRLSSAVPAPDSRALTQLARETLLAEGHVQVELSVSFVDDDEMAGLHERYMHEAGPTDVLTFPLDDDDVESGRQGARRRRGRARGRRPQQPRRPADGAAAAPGARDPAPARLRPRGRGRARRDVGAAGALQRGDGAVTWMWVLVLVLVVLGSLLALAESSLTRMSRVRALALEDEGRRNAALLVRLATDPPRYLNSVYLAVMIVQNGSAILVAILAESEFGSLGVTIASLVFTMLYFVVVEAMSKTFGVLHSDRIALALAPLVYFLGRLLALPTRALIGLANVLLPGKGIKAGPFVSEEIRSMAQVGSEEGSIEEGEKELIHSIFEFGDTIVREVMVPRPDIIAIEDDKALRDVQALVLTHGTRASPSTTTTRVSTR